MSIAGELEGVRLELIPAAIVPWEVWWADHPETTVLQTSSSRYSTRQQRFTSDFVIGIALGEDAKAYSYERASGEGAVNDHIDPYAVVVVADTETKSVHRF